MRAGPSQEEIRRQNLGALLRHVHLHGATSRAELTASLRLNRSTIGALTAELATAGLITEQAPRETGRAGRPSLVVRPESARVFAYACSVEMSRLRAARVGLGGVVLDRRQAPRPPGLTVEDALPVLAGFIEAMHRSVADDSVYVGSGVAVGGRALRPDGTVPVQHSGDWLDKPLREALGDFLPPDRPVLFDDIADACAVAEHTRGAATGYDDVIYLHRDGGIDAGIIAGGRRLTGQGGHGGAVGHMVVRPGGRRCGCGSYGCWETEIGDYAPATADGTAEGDQDAVLRMIDAAARGDANAQAAVRQVGDWLGFGVANLVNIFNPGVVIFGGTLREVYLAAAARVRSRLNSMALPAAREQVRLRTPQLGEDAALVGAAELAFEHLLADPLDAAGVAAGRVVTPCPPPDR